MTSYPAHLLAPAATIAAAFIAGCVAFLVAVLSKEQKTSEFRQQWIDGLRTDISDVIGEVTILAFLHSKKEGEPVLPGELSDRYENLVKIRSLVARIELRINPKEHRDFVDSLQALKRATDEKSNFHDEVDALTIESQKLLKKEWNVVKSGELTFRATKVAAAALVCAALLAGAGTIFFDLLRNQQGPTPAASTKSAP